MYNDVSWTDNISNGGPLFNPNDFNTFYHSCFNAGSFITTYLKWQFVTDGEAILDEDWLGWENITLESPGAVVYQHETLHTDGNYMYGASSGYFQNEIEWNALRCVSFDGEFIFEKQMHDWYMPDDNGIDGSINGGFHHIDFKNPYELLLVSHTCCLHQMINTSRLVEDVDDDTDMVIWENANGDYFMDVAYGGVLEPAWFCIYCGDDENQRRDCAQVDANGFSMIGDAAGLSSFGIATPDGTGIGEMAFSDEIINTFTCKGGGMLCDSGSNYDGMYFNGPLPEGEITWTSGEQAQTYFVAFDSVKGVITNQPVGVEEETQAAFSVDQNSPNPFNPTTTINFTLPSADNVIVEIYNVAGQKVDTLSNDFMDAGKHSVVWNASGFSNGIYFYTVKSGDLSRTMKMTLLK